MNTSKADRPDPDRQFSVKIWGEFLDRALQYRALQRQSSAIINRWKAEDRHSTAEERAELDRIRIEMDYLAQGCVWTLVHVAEESVPEAGYYFRNPVTIEPKDGAVLLAIAGAHTE